MSIFPSSSYTAIPLPNRPSATYPHAAHSSCPGNHVAERSVFINLAHIFWALDIAEDPAAPIDSMAFEHIANTRPKPFQPIIRPRAGLSAASIRDVLLREDPTLEEGWLAV